MHLLEVKNLTVSFDTSVGVFNAVKGIDLYVDAREVLAIVGESGSGKSVAMLAVMGLLPPTATVTADKMEFDGKNLLAMSAADRRKIIGKDVAMIFQEPMTSLNPCFTVGFQIEEVLRFHLGMDRQRRRARAVELLDQVGIPNPAERLKSYPPQMSGGQNQRVMIAMALAGEPELLVADEPTTALDVTIQAQILDLLGTIRRDTSMGLVLISHDLGVVSETCSRIAVMYAGRIVEQAESAAIFANPSHPYTRGLLGAMPPISGPRQKLVSIPGSVPEASRMPQGCAFAPRCSEAIADCTRVDPAAVTVEANHLAACIRATPAKTGTRTPERVLA